MRSVLHARLGGVLSSELFNRGDSDKIYMKSRFWGPTLTQWTEMCSGGKC